MLGVELPPSCRKASRGSSSLDLETCARVKTTGVATLGVRIPVSCSTATGGWSCFYSESCDCAKTTSITTLRVVLYVAVILSFGLLDFLCWLQFASILSHSVTRIIFALLEPGVGVGTNGFPTIGVQLPVSCRIAFRWPSHYSLRNLWWRWGNTCRDARRQVASVVSFGHSYNRIGYIGLGFLS